MEQREQHRGPPGPPVGQGGAPAGVLVVMAAAAAASDAGTESEDVAESLGIFVTSQLGITIDNC